MKDRLFTPSYFCMLSANFLLYFGFWLLVPVLPFYLKEYFACEEGIIGIVLSCYTVSALLIRPFSGYLLDALRASRCTCWRTSCSPPSLRATSSAAR